MLAEASIHLTGILLIGPHLTPENCTDLLSRVRFRTKREIERLVAELAPAPAAPARIEPLHGAPNFEERIVDSLTPARTRNTWAAFARALAGPIRAMQAGVGAGQAPPAAIPESSADVSGGPPLGTGDPRPVPWPPPQVSAGPRYRVQFTADQAFVDLLEEARDLLQHSIPDRDIVEVQRRALQALVKKLRARTCAAAERPRAPKGTIATARRTRPQHPAESVEVRNHRAGAAPHPGFRSPHRLAARLRSLHLHRRARPTLPRTSGARDPSSRTPCALWPQHGGQPDAALSSAQRSRGGAGLRPRVDAPEKKAAALARSG